MAFITLSHGDARHFAPAATPAFVNDVHRAAGEALRLAVRLGLVITRIRRGRQKVRRLTQADDAVLHDLGIARNDISRLMRPSRR